MENQRSTEAVRSIVAKAERCMAEVICLHGQLMDLPDQLSEVLEAQMDKSNKMDNRLCADGG